MKARGGGATQSSEVPEDIMDPLTTPSRPIPTGASSAAGQPAPGTAGHPARKRKGHRGGKKKKSRRKSFAAPADDPLAQDAHEEGLGENGDAFYHNHNLSNTSIDSENLLDHRDQKHFLRPRRPSLMTPNSASFQPPFPVTQSASRLRTVHASKNSEDDDDYDEDGPWNESAPLLSQSVHRAQTFAGYGSGDVPRRSRPHSRRDSSRSSSKRKFANPFAASATGTSYNVNYPPSVPGTPPLRASDPMDMTFGDVLLRDGMENGSRSPRREGSRERQRDEQPVFRPSPLDRRRTIALQAQEDVCFPQEGLSEIADDDIRSQDPAAYRTRGRRRRGKWPDLAIMEEWSRMEKEGRSEERRAKKITEPQLINGRLRSVNRGWYQAEEEAPYRFTYFNEELQSTIHSQTISELVQPGGTFRELFIPDPPLLSDSSDDEYEEQDPAVALHDVLGGQNGESRAPTREPSIADKSQTAQSILEQRKEKTMPPIEEGKASPALVPTQEPSYVDTAHTAQGAVDPRRERVMSPVQDSRSPTRQSSTTNLAQLSSMAPETRKDWILEPRKESVDLRRDRMMSPVHDGLTSVGSKRSKDSKQNSGEHTPLDFRSPARVKSPENIKVPKPPRYGDRPTWWLDVLRPSEAEMKVLAKAFGIHPLTAEDILMQEAREKVELFRHYYFINYKSFDQDQSSENFLEPVNMYVVVFREGVLSFHWDVTPHPANVRRRIRQLSDYLILSSDWISYAIIDDITDVFGPLIQKIEDEVDEIDDAILQLHSSTHDLPGENKKGDPSRSESGETTAAESGGDMLRRVGDCRKRVMSLYRLLGNKADVIKGFAKRCNERWEVAPKSEIGLYLGDIQDHIVTMTSNLSHYEKILARSHGNYLAQINIRMNERQEQTADVLGKLTVLGTIVLPMNIITGLWGMNVWVPGQQYEGDLKWFMGITAGLVFFGVACYVIAKRVYGIV